MIEPDVDTVLAAVVGAIETEIAPQADEYAASVCRTAAQMLQQVRARLREEEPALTAGNAELRALLLEIDPADLPHEVAATVDAAVQAVPRPSTPGLTELRADARRLRAALVRVVESAPEDHPARKAGRAHIAEQLRREVAWQQDAYTGPRR